MPIKNADIVKIFDKKQDTTHQMFDSFGKLTSKKDSVCAQIISVGKSNIYMVKIDKNNNLYNPLKDDRFYGLNMVNKNTKGIVFKLREVTESAFLSYVSFLNNRETSVLNIAQRKVK